MTKEKKRLESKAVIVDADCAHHWERNRQYMYIEQRERERAKETLNTLNGPIEKKTMLECKEL